MITFTIPGLPPSKSNNYRSGHGHFFKNSKVRDYEKVFQLSTLKVPKHTFGDDERLGIRIQWWSPHLRSDIDGITKILLDCCQTANIFKNDNKVDNLIVERYGVDKLNPRVIIEIWGRKLEEE